MRCILLLAICCAALRADTLSDGKFIDLLYEDVLDRAPGPVDLSTDLGYLETLDGTPQGLALMLLSSVEYRSNLISAYYESYLARPADPFGLNGFLNQFTEGATDETVQSQILGSPEYFIDEGSSNAQFIGAVYSQLLNRPPTPSEIDAWLNFLNVGTRPDFVDQVLASPEYLDILVDGYFESYLDRPADPEGLSGFVSQITEGATNEEVQSQILGSPEFYADAQIVASPEPISFFEGGAGALLLCLIARKR